MLEEGIKDIVGQKLNDGTIEKIIAEKMEKGIEDAMENLFRSYGGGVGKLLEDKIKSVLVPYLEAYDYSEYIVKLDDVLKDILNQTTFDNKKTLENFRGLMLSVDKKILKSSELFEEWQKYVENNVKTDDLEVDYDDEVTYESVHIEMNFEENEERDWSSFKHGILILECEHDETMNFEIPLSFWKDGIDRGWDIKYKTSTSINSLRYLNDFELFLMRMAQANVQIEMDTYNEEDDVTPEKRPEPYFE